MQLMYCEWVTNRLIFQQTKSNWASIILYSFSEKSVILFSFLKDKLWFLKINGLIANLINQILFVLFFFSHAHTSLHPCALSLSHTLFHTHNLIVIAPMDVVICHAKLFRYSNHDDDTVKASVELYVATRKRWTAALNFC